MEVLGSSNSSESQPGGIDVNFDEAIVALDRLARQKKTDQKSVERILDDLLATSMESFSEGKSHESKS